MTTNTLAMLGAAAAAAAVGAILFLSNQDSGGQPARATPSPDPRGPTRQLGPLSTASDQIRSSVVPETEEASRSIPKAPADGHAIQSTRSDEMPVLQGYLTSSSGPAEGAMVFAYRDQDSGAAWADATGFYRIELPTTGEFEVEVSDGGFIWPPPASVEVEGVTPYSVSALEGNAVVRGMVLDQHGEPAPSLPVEVHHWETKLTVDGIQYRGIGPTIASTISNDDGTFVIPDLPAMYLGIVAAPNSNRDGVASLTSAPSKSVEVDLAAGNATDVRLDVVLADRFTATLRIVGNLAAVRRVEVRYENLVGRSGPNPIPHPVIEQLDATADDPASFVWRIGPYVPPVATATVVLEGGRVVTCSLQPSPNEDVDIDLHI